MCGGNVGPENAGSVEDRQNALRKYRRDAAAGKVGNFDWAHLDEATRKSYEAKGYDEARYNAEAQKNLLGNYEGAAKAQLGQDYIDPKTGRALNAAPLQPDATDEALKKARTQMALRLQVGKNRSSSFTTPKGLGGFDVSRPVLGGY